MVGDTEGEEYLEEHLISRVHGEDHLGNTNPDTAHQTSQDTWFQVGFLLTTAANSAYVLGYSAAIMVPLGWVGGVLGFIAATALSLYANCLIAKLHRFGGKRHIRYRDLAGHIYGSNAYRLTWALQYANFTLINIGYVIVAGQALKDAYILLWDNHAMKLPHFIAIAGFVCATFAISIPHLSALRVWLGFSTIFTLVYIIITVVLSLTNGIKAPARNYSIPGSEASKVFRAISATADLFFAFSTGMLPEIKATMRQPAVENMRKALFLQLTVGVLPMYAVVFVGYWAFGNSASSYLLSSISGPVWLKTAANLAAFFQSVIVLHMTASPVYEYLDTNYGPKESATCFKTMSFRITVRGGYLAISTFLAALLPFLGDFMSLTGASCTIPLTFILGNHMYMMANGNKLIFPQRLWHWLNIGFFSLLSVAAAVASVRLIVEDSKTYHVFGDL